MNTSPNQEFTEKVLKAYSNIDNPRLKSVISILIKHLHACVKEMKVTDQEWEFAWDFMKRMAEKTSPLGNEFLFFADVMGLSQLIEILNHGEQEQPVGVALVGPFFRADAPFRERGASIASDDAPGARVRISGRVFEFENNAPIEGAILDIWQAAANGLYENQDERQPDYHLRGRFRTDKNGTFELIALMPTAYHIPDDGPVGEFLKIAKRPPSGRRTSMLSCRRLAMKRSSRKSSSKGIRTLKTMSFLRRARTWSAISSRKGMSFVSPMIFRLSEVSRPCRKHRFPLRTIGCAEARSASFE